MFLRILVIKIFIDCFGEIFFDYFGEIFFRLFKRYESKNCMLEKMFN